MPDFRADFEAMKKALEVFRSKYGKEAQEAALLLDDCPMYPAEDVKELYRLTNGIRQDESLIPAFREKLASMKKLENAPERIYLWPEGKMPGHTVYTDNSDYKYTHNPDFKPYMLEMLLPENVTPKGAIIMIPGGDQGASTVNGGFATSLDFNALGYQCFILHNRVFNNPWDGPEVGVDVARAVRIVRANAEKYRIDPNHVAVCGYSNGGIAGEQSIRYCSGKQTVAEHFPGYEPDELDEIYGCQDAFLCIYGPRFKGMEFDWTEVEYPPVFYAIGREDNAIDNFNATYPSLLEHNVPVEIHTFAGVPHGFAGRSYTDGKAPYPIFDLWVQLADNFMQDVYKKQAK